MAGEKATGRHPETGAVLPEGMTLAKRRGGWVEQFGGPKVSVELAAGLSLDGARYASGTTAKVPLSLLAWKPNLVPDGSPLHEKVRALLDKSAAAVEAEDAQAEAARKAAAAEAAAEDALDAAEAAKREASTPDPEAAKAGGSKAGK